MYPCQMCGKQSRTHDFCEWCRNPMSAPGSQPTMQMPPSNQPTMQIPQGAQPTLQIPPQGQTMRRVSLTGEVVESVPSGYSAQPGMPPNMMPPHNQPPALHPSALPAAAYSAVAMQARYDNDRPSLWARWEKALGIGMPILALSILLTYFVNDALLWMILLNLFVLPMILGACAAIPRYEEAITDCAIMLVVTFLFGPLLALIIYGIVCLIWSLAIFV